MTSLQLSIDSADDVPGIALASASDPVEAFTWRTERNQSVELLPAIARLLADGRRDKSDLTAIFVDIGPGGYAALRVGISLAKSLAHALEVPIVGVGRLELGAYLVRGAAGGRRIVPVHRAGRGEVAWGAYREDAVWREEAAPVITKCEQLAAALREGDVVTGDIEDELARSVTASGASLSVSEQHRVLALAALGAARLAAGRTDDPIALIPLYLRAPAVAPQR